MTGGHKERVKPGWNSRNAELSPLTKIFFGTMAAKREMCRH